MAMFARTYARGAVMDERNRWCGRQHELALSLPDPEPDLVAALGELRREPPDLPQLGFVTAAPDPLHRLSPAGS